MTDIDQRTEGRSAFRKLRSLVIDYLPAILLIVALIVFWELFNVIFDQPDYILPPLHDILYAAYIHASDQFLPNAWVTFQEVIIGYLVAVVSGLLIGVGISESATLRRASLPLVISFPGCSDPGHRPCSHHLVRIRHDSKDHHRRIDLVLPDRHYYRYRSSVRVPRHAVLVGLALGLPVAGAS